MNDNHFIVRKELSILFQFTLITIIVGCVFFGMVMLQSQLAWSYWYVYKLVLINWLVTFNILSFIKITFLYFTQGKQVKIYIEEREKSSFKKEMSKSFQYLVLAIISVVSPLWVSLFWIGGEVGKIINIFDVWFAFREVFLAWVIGFLILSLIRLGIIYLNNKNH